MTLQGLIIYLVFKKVIFYFWKYSSLIVVTYIQPRICLLQDICELSDSLCITWVFQKRWWNTFCLCSRIYVYLRLNAKYQYFNVQMFKICGQSILKVLSFSYWHIVLYIRGLTQWSGLRLHTNWLYLDPWLLKSVWMLHISVGPS